MSERGDGRKMSLIRPGYFLAGLVLMFGYLSWQGWRFGHRDYHPDFLRLHPRISPEGQYQPTVSELCAVVRSRCRPDQILVIVGGNSIFNGVGQPPGQIWTQRLQEDLGNRYVVVNFSLRGAMAVDGGAVVAEVLRNEYPRMIYVANTGALVASAPVGMAPYRYLFWEAYFKGWLSPDNVRATAMGSLDRDMRPSWDIAGEMWLDAVLHYRDFWNYIGYQHVFTVPSFYTPALPGAAAPRRELHDEEPDFRAMPQAARLRPEANEAELSILRGFTDRYYSRSDSHWVMNPRKRNAMIGQMRAMFPDVMKPRVLIVLSGNNPYYLDQITPEERVRNVQGNLDTIEMMKEAGLRCVSVEGKMEKADFGDRAHLNADGGAKLAKWLAPEIETMAKQLGYFDGKATP